MGTEFPSVFQIFSNADLEKQHKERAAIYAFLIMFRLCNHLFRRGFV